VLGLSLNEWFGFVQALATVVAVYFAWRSVIIARDTRREAAQEKRRARLERIRGAVGELERLKRWGGNSKELEIQKEQLSTLVPSVGALPATTALAHWHPSYKALKTYSRPRAWKSTRQSKMRWVNLVANEAARAIDRRRDDPGVPPR
jgi:hypothetical protein